MKLKCVFFRELEAEIIKMNTDEFKWGVNWQQGEICQRALSNSPNYKGRIVASLVCFTPKVASPFPSKIDPQLSFLLIDFIDFASIW